jgi:hypothetical protein
MTPTEPEPTSPLDDALIDRIVDGELSPTELGAALGRLDCVPDGWKRCALAFLEAQCWRESFLALDLPATRPIEPAFAATTSSSERGRRLSAAWKRGAIAAGIAAISFALGWIVHPGSPSSPARNEAQRSAVSIATHASDRLPAPTEDPEAGRAAVSANYGEFAPSPGPWIRPDPREAVVTVGRVRIGSLSGGAEVPILAGPTIDEEWLRKQPPALNPYQRAILERQGYQVDQHRRIITARLPDGRRVSVPIDQVQVSYTGNNPL